MLKDIAKRKVKDYNEVIQYVNNFYISEKDYLYGHNKKFIRLRKEIKKEAHRVISFEALQAYSDKMEVSSAIDINGNIYYFDVFSDGYYRVSDMEKYKDLNMEVIDEEYIKRNS